MSKKEVFLVGKSESKNGVRRPDLKSIVMSLLVRYVHIILHNPVQGNLCVQRKLDVEFVKIILQTMYARKRGTG